jgi:glucosamine--fructose-6-phosphate aminotransferase (isomerizing)
MCGIVGYAGTKDAVPLLMDGLARLEYRGYDSAGIAVVEDDATLAVRKSVGRLAELAKHLTNGSAVSGRVGIGHTRWATHGRPSDENAHPHTDCTGRLCVVHNGIVENHAELRAQLRATGHTMVSETDTEVIAHLIEGEIEGAGDGTPTERLVAATQRALDQVRGLYAVAVLWLDAPDVIVGARRRAPLIVGLADHGVFLASDIPAVLGQTKRVVRLQDGDLVAVHPDGVSVTDASGAARELVTEEIGWDVTAAEKEGYPHFFLKEVHEQPEALERTLAGHLIGGRVQMPELEAIDVARVRRIVLTGCGSAYHSCLMAQYALEEWLGLPVEAAIASELRYRRSTFDESVLCVAVSQSGETADTIAAFELAGAGGAQRIAVTNTVGSALTTLGDAVVNQQSGPEVCVVASKTFTGQIAALFLVGLWLGDRMGRLPQENSQALVAAMAAIPRLARTALENVTQPARLGESCSHLDRLLFLGRGIGYPTALEGALKLKEISYIQAEGYAAGELKHGPLALVDDRTTVLVVATDSPILEKLLSNVEVVRARGGRIIAIASEGDDRVIEHADEIIWVPRTLEALSPIINVIPMQLLSYHAAVARGCDVDKPRNLAKSVTVE